IRHVLDAVTELVQSRVGRNGQVNDCAHARPDGTALSVVFGETWPAQDRRECLAAILADDPTRRCVQGLNGGEGQCLAGEIRRMQLVDELRATRRHHGCWPIHDLQVERLPYRVCGVRTACQDQRHSCIPRGTLQMHGENLRELPIAWLEMYRSWTMDEPMPGAAERSLCDSSHGALCGLAGNGRHRRCLRNRDSAKLPV